MAKLETSDHPRYAEGYRYVYPVVSRRAGGVSIGVNLNPNDACNWRCVYCQVPGLVAGKGPAIDTARLADELEHLMGLVLEGDFMEARVPEGARRLNDVAISGNGEATSSPDFEPALQAIERVLHGFGLLPEPAAPFEGGSAEPGPAPRQSPWLPAPLKVVLITNGSLVHKPDVQRGLARLARMNGEVWFKLDAASDAALARINNSALGIDKQLANLRTAAGLCPTFVQTAAFRRQAPGAASAHDDVLGGPNDVLGGTGDAYLGALAELLDQAVPLRGVHLYSLARPSHQPEAPELVALKGPELEPLAAQIRALGLAVTVNE